MFRTQQNAFDDIVGEYRLFFPLLIRLIRTASISVRYLRGRVSKRMYAIADAPLL